MTRLLLIVPATFLALAQVAAADPIEGSWKRPNGGVVAFSKCGAKFCATAKTAPYSGKSAGALAANGEGYKGSLIELSTGKTYSGKASITGATLKVSGCVLGGLICKSENWARQ
jgi:uncharacterized protein (DUF2147 family)